MRLTVDGAGTVAKVTILESRPQRVFDRAVIRALSQWKFEATGTTQNVETEVVFNGEG